MKGIVQEVMHDVGRDGRAELQELMRFGKEHRTPWQPIPVLISAVLPLVLCAWVYFCCCFSLRFYQPTLAAVLGPCIGLVFCIVSTLQTRSSLRQMGHSRAKLSLCISLWLGLAVGMLCGEQNYIWHMVSYYEFQDLAAYTNVDPMTDKGQSYMDAGQIYFREFSKVNIEQMVVFRSQRVYCAAPILVDLLSNQDGDQLVEQAGQFHIPESGTVDWWAVGMDCCDQETRTFTCGAVGDPRARAGIRLLRNDVRPFYTLAVQEWEARQCPLDDNTLKGKASQAPLICPQSRHPLFFHWVVDPLLEVDNYWAKAASMYGFHMVVFFVGNFVLTLGMLWGFLLLGVR